MKKIDHLRSLIADLETYERELQERVRQKEAELELLLKQLAPVKNSSSCLPTTTKPDVVPASSVLQLRIARAPGVTASGRTVEASPSPCLTGEQRRLQPPVFGARERQQKQQKLDRSSSADIDGVSPISSSSAASTDSGGLAETRRLLLESDERTIRRPPRRVRFASRSPCVVSMAVEKPASKKENEMKRSRKPRPTPLPESPLTVTHSQRSSSARGNTYKDDKACIMETSPETCAGMENQNNLGSTGITGVVDDEPCYLRRRPKHERCVHRESMKLPNVGDTSTAVALPNASSACDSASFGPLHRNEGGVCLQSELQQGQQQQQQHQYQLQLSSYIPTKRPRASVSRSISAARSRDPAVAQQEGRGAGIVVACGPTLFFD
ncbi:hypothetical protein DQ04_01211040 [Trypanosoma grayi]|uniref:hypothetical protein n=1 Tax=Trypanosoma grayi TaxID=71804 RepID=UPI0004F48436|nr:hypothetical protein DQ04_01211040 [Trypanosoma grayi]KEG13105.1 hypothetical protein DQ04_01211040 [Trypanosoma grayi]